MPKASGLSKGSAHSAASSGWRGWEDGQKNAAGASSAACPTQGGVTQLPGSQWHVTGRSKDGLGTFCCFLADFSPGLWSSSLRKMTTEVKDWLGS